MDVTAYDLSVTPPTPSILGSVVAGIWVKTIQQSTEERSLEAVPCYESPTPAIVDNIATIQGFTFQAARSFGSSTTPLGDCLQFIATHRASVPRVATIQFNSGGKKSWLVGCGIKSVNVVEKTGALIIFSYGTIGGAWTIVNPLTT